MLTAAHTSSPISGFQAPLARVRMERFVRQKLTQQERLIVTLHYAEGLTPEEISCVLHIPDVEVRRILAEVIARVSREFLPVPHKKELVACA